MNGQRDDIGDAVCVGTGGGQLDAAALEPMPGSAGGAGARGVAGAPGAVDERLHDLCGWRLYQGESANPASAGPGSYRVTITYQDTGSRYNADSCYFAFAELHGDADPYADDYDSIDRHAAAITDLRAGYTDRCALCASAR